MEEADFEEVVRATDGEAVATTLAAEATVEKPPERTEDATETGATAAETTGAATLEAAKPIVLMRTPTIPRS